MGKKNEDMDDVLTATIREAAEAEDEALEKKRKKKRRRKHGK